MDFKLIAKRLVSNCCYQAIHSLIGTARAKSARDTPTIDPRIEREPQFVIIAPVFKNGPVRAYRANVEASIRRK